RDGSACRRDLAHDAVGCVGDEDVTAAIDRNSVGLVQECGCGRTAIAVVATGCRRETSRAGSRNGADSAAGVDLAYDVVDRISEKEIASGVIRNRRRPAQLGVSSGAVVARVSEVSGAGNGRDCASRNLAQSVIPE